MRNRSLPSSSNSVRSGIVPGLAPKLRKSKPKSSAGVSRKSGVALAEVGRQALDGGPKTVFQPRSRRVRQSKLWVVRELANSSVVPGARFNSRSGL